jgi:dTDP-4-amino-4,6-dideoxygalactose transaminase
MLGERSCRAPGFNGKMSEYHSAVGLAELDGWEVKKQALRSVAERYREAFSKHSLTDRIVAAPLVASCYVLFEAASSREAEAVRTSLTQGKIDHRLWYGLGLHREPYFASTSQDDLQVTDAIAETLIGLPTAPDLPVEVIGRIAATIASAV